jgi:hypothetical protein
VTDLSAVARVPLTNSVNRSNQNQRIDYPSTA